MHTRRAVVLVPLALCLSAGALSQSASAQTPPPAKGARVRVVQTNAKHPGVFEGRLFRLRADTVTIELSVPGGSVFDFPLDAGWRLEVPGQSRRHVGRRVVRGAAIGAVALGFLTYVSYEPCTSEAFLGCMLDTGPGGAAAAGAVGGAFLGGVVGLAVGLLTRDAEWLPVRTEGVRVGLAPLPAGRLGIGAAVRF